MQHLSEYASPGCRSWQKTEHGTAAGDGRFKRGSTLEMEIYSRDAYPVATLDAVFCELTAEELDIDDLDDFLLFNCLEMVM